MLNTMTTVYDVPPDRLIAAAKQELKKIKDIVPPDWSRFVKTGAHKERPPVDPDWWWTRCAAILRTTYVRGPIGVTRLRTKYGGRRNCGSKPEKFRRGSGKIIRVILQQADKAGFTQVVKEKGVKCGRMLTQKGKAFLEELK